ncbi:MAG: restriction endonuclease subunit S [Acidimicrobiaceae bacterium]|nr:restriction endonuclease subunit S [Acidimicrobiaceae bacterium]
MVLTREAPVGEAFAIPEDMKICLGQRVVLIRPLQVLLGKFLVELIYSGQGRRQLRRLVVGTTNPHLNVDDIRSLTFGIPPLHEQRHAMRALDALDERLEVENQELAKLRQVRVGLAEDLLSGRVRTVAA